MKLRQYITMFSLILALTGLSPVAAAEAGSTSDGEQILPDQRQFESPVRYKLSPGQMDMVRAGRIDPYRGYRFRIEIDGIDRGGFREAWGLDATQDPIEYREGTEPITARKVIEALITY